MNNNDIETRLKELANKWKHANMEVFDVCRDAAEELRVLRTKLNVLEEMAKPKFYPNYSSTLGWGKGKDE